MNIKCKELGKNNHCIMRRINSPQRGEGARRSGATSSDDNEAVANLDKQNALIICAQFLRERLL